MPISVPNPYSGKDEDTCSVSFAAQQSMASGVGSPQTEAEFYTSKLLGEWGVIKGKLANGHIPNGTKVLAYENVSTGSRGYLYIKDGKLHKKVHLKFGTVLDKEANTSLGDQLIKSSVTKVSIPQSVSPKTEPELVPVFKNDIVNLDNNLVLSGKPFLVTKSGDYIAYDGKTLKFVKYHQSESGYGFEPGEKSFSIKVLMGEEEWFKTEEKPGTKPSSEKTKKVTAAQANVGDTILGEDGVWYVANEKTKFGDIYVFYNKEEEKYFLQAAPNAHVTVKTSEETKGSDPTVVPATTTPPPSPTQVAAPTPVTPVNSGSASVGSMSHEDVAAMFVKIKDDLAKEKGLNIKGANPALDEEVYKAIGNATGYTPAEVKAKIDAYKADGNKLSALKKKVQAGTKKVPTGNAGGPKPLVPGSGEGKPDPKPHGVPTVATPSVTNQVKQEVKQEAEANPTKVYSDEDVAAAYIIAKDKVVAASNGKWTLYTKSEEMDLEIAIQVGLKTGLNPLQQKQAIANYLGTGKKLSVLKKQLAKQGAFTPQADTLKKSKAEQSQDEKAEEVAQKAEEGYTPTPTPTTGTPPIDTGKPMPKAPAQAARESGSIEDVANTVKSDVYSLFKSQGSKAYLSSSNGDTYDAMLKVQVNMKADGQELSLLQILRIIDEQGAKKFNAENAKLFEKKVATWLTSPEGTAHIKKAELEKAKLEAQAKAKAEALKIAKEMEANQPPLPADSAQFEGWSLDKAKRVSQTWLDVKPWDARQKRDLTHYTGNAYHEMNSHLRKGSGISERSKNAIEGAKMGMRPTTEPILVQRGTGFEQFETLGIQGTQDAPALWGLAGKTLLDPGFLSTSAGGRAAFGGKPCILEVECPVGTPMAYVAPISNYPHENEMLLQAGMKYKVLNVRKNSNGQYVVRMRVVDWPGKVTS